MTRISWTPEMDRLALQCLAAAESQWSAWEDWRSKAGSMAAAVGYEAYRARATRLRDREQQPANDVVANDVRPAEPQRLQRVLFVPDSHWPLVDRVAWNVMILAAQALRPDVVVVLGDYLDMASMSAHPANDLDGESNAITEIAKSREGLAQLNALGASRKLFIEGNHERRLQRQIVQRLPALHGAVTARGLLELDAAGWEWYPYQQLAHVGKLVITHDMRDAGSTAVERALQKAGTNVVIGHTHAMCVTYRGDATGRRKVGAVFGHLTAPEATRYDSPVRVDHFHQLGFGTGTLLPDGAVVLQAHPILVDSEGYRTVVDGQLFQIRTQHPRGAA